MLRKIEEAKNRFVRRRFVERKRGLKRLRFKKKDLEVKRVCLW